MDLLTLWPRPLTFKLKSISLRVYPKVILYTKFEHFGIIRFWVKLRTNKQPNRQTNKQTAPNVLPTYQVISVKLVNTWWDLDKTVYPSWNTTTWWRRDVFHQGSAAAFDCHRSLVRLALSSSPAAPSIAHTHALLPVHCYRLYTFIIISYTNYTVCLIKRQHFVFWITHIKNHPIFTILVHDILMKFELRLVNLPSLPVYCRRVLIRAHTSAKAQKFKI